MISYDSDDNICSIRYNPSFCPANKKDPEPNMGTNNKSSVNCIRPCSCLECKLRYVDFSTFASKTFSEKLEDKIVNVFGFYYQWMIPITFGLIGLLMLFTVMTLAGPRVFTIWNILSVIVAILIFINANEIRRWWF